MPDTAAVRGKAYSVCASMAVGAVVLGYYLIYSAGIRWRLREIV